MLHVVTHTNPFSCRDLRPTIQSVADALPRGGVHHIIPCSGNLMEARWEALNLGPHVCFVDDDDTIHKDALVRGMMAFGIYKNAGLVFTDEVHVNPDGSPIHHNRGQRFYKEIELTATRIHHLAIIRTDAVNPGAFKMAEDNHLAVEWLIKATAALEHGAVHVPMDGYFWTQHPEQHHKARVWQDAYAKAARPVSEKLKALAKFEGAIPQFSYELEGGIPRHMFRHP